MPRKDYETTQSEMRHLVGGISAFANLLCQIGFALEYKSIPKDNHLALYWIGTIAFGMISEISFFQIRSENLGMKYALQRVIIYSSLLAGVTFVVEKIMS